MMRISSIGYFLKEGFKNVWNNRMMSFASVLVMICCFILTGGAMLLSVNISRVLKSIEDQNVINVYLDYNITSAEARNIGEKIEKIPNVLECRYYPKEEAVKEYQEMLGSLFDVLKENENPLPDAYHVTMEDLSLYDMTASEIKKISGVDTVSDRSDTASKLTSLNNLVTNAGIWTIIALGAVSLFIISNTIKVTMYSRRFEISIMKSVGATNWFIRIPFIIEGIVIGLISAVISTAVLKFVYDELMMVINKIVPFQGIPFSSLVYYIAGSFTVAGILFGLIGGIISISRYLKKEGGDVVVW